MSCENGPSPVPEGTGDNSPTFQRWGSASAATLVPKGRLEDGAVSTVPSGLGQSLTRHWAHPDTATAIQEKSNPSGFEESSRRSQRSEDLRGPWKDGLHPGWGDRIIGPQFVQAGSLAH